MDKKVLLFRRMMTAALALLIALTLAFIWHNSFEKKSDSAQKSSYVTEKIVKPVAEPIVGPGKVTDHGVRKMAHMVEFFLLGTEVTLLLAVRGLLCGPGFSGAMLFGVLTAMTDETIQLYSDRGSQLTDVWLDSASFAAALLLSGLVCFLFIRRMRKKVA